MTEADLEAWREQTAGMSADEKIEMLLHIIFEAGNRIQALERRTSLPDPTAELLTRVCNFDGSPQGRPGQAVTE